MCSSNKVILSGSNVCDVGAAQLTVVKSQVLQCFFFGNGMCFQFPVRPPGGSVSVPRPAARWQCLSSPSRRQVAVCALQCLGRCAPLLPPPTAGAAVWCQLAELLTTRLTEPTGEDSMDSAGEAVLSMVRTANHRAALVQRTNQNTADTLPTNGNAAPIQSSNQSTDSAQSANAIAECPLAGWLAANRLASCALTSLLKAGPGGRRVAHWLLKAATGPVWTDIQQNAELAQVGSGGVTGLSSIVFN